MRGAPTCRYTEKAQTFHTLAQACNSPNSPMDEAYAYAWLQWPICLLINSLIRGCSSGQRFEPIKCRTMTERQRKDEDFRGNRQAFGAKTAKNRQNPLRWPRFLPIFHTFACDSLRKSMALPRAYKGDAICWRHGAPSSCKESAEAVDDIYRFGRFLAKTTLRHDRPGARSHSSVEGPARPLPARDDDGHPTSTRVGLADARMGPCTPWPAEAASAALRAVEALDAELAPLVEETLRDLVEALLHLSPRGVHDLAPFGHALRDETRQVVDGHA